jgi:16S rRNA (guanine966-N2)-methyltransferase
VTRIIAGSARGRRLQTPKGDRTRPTSDRVREALFSAIEAWCGSLHGLHFLDLYAGSGAVGLEAASRGAESVLLVESHRRTAQLIEDNARTIGCSGVTVRAAAVLQVVVRQPEVRYDVAFLDPPYDLTDDDLAETLTLLQEWLSPEALVVVERSSRSPEPSWPEGILADRSKRYGETVLWYGHAAPMDPTETEGG